jgi:hypothetical protein
MLIVVSQALALLGLAGAEAVHLRFSRPAVALTSAAFFALCALSLIVCVRGLWRLSQWVRSPILLAQVIGLLLAYSLWNGGFRAAAAVVAVPSAIALIGLFHPASTRALFGTDEDA